MKRTINKSFAALLLALLLLLGSGCSLIEGFLGGGTDEEVLLEEQEEEEDPEYPVSIAGAQLSVRPDRVVSLSPALTEKVINLGLGEQLVGVSRYCVDLAGTEGKADCGTMLLPDLDEIRALEPYLILTSDNLPEEALIQLQQMGVEVAVFDRAESVDELLDIYTGIAILFEGETTGGMIGTDFAAGFRTRLDDIVTATAPYSGAVVIYLRGMPFTMATGDTLEQELLAKAGMINVAEDQQGWIFPADQAEIPENRQLFEMAGMIFMDKSSVTIADLEQHDYYKTLPAVLQDNYLYIDATAFERQAVSMLDELVDMAMACYPDCGLIPTQQEAPDDPSGDEEAQESETGQQENVQEGQDAA